MTDAESVKPRDDCEAPPLPGCPRFEIPGARLMASTSDASPRSSIWSRGMTSTLAGVCIGVSPRFDPTAAGSCSTVGVAAALTITGASSCMVSVFCANAGKLSAAAAATAVFRLTFIGSGHACPRCFHGHNEGTPNCMECRTSGYAPWRRIRHFRLGARVRNRLKAGHPRKTIRSSVPLRYSARHRLAEYRGARPA